MSYGIHITGSNGFTQVDQNYQNYILIAEGSASTGSTITFTTTDAPIVMVSVTPSDRIYLLESITSSSFKVLSHAANSGSGTGSGPDLAPNFTFSYRVYGRAGQHVSTSYGEYGLRVLTPNGEVAFDSNYRYPRILQIADMGSSPNVQAVNVPGAFTPFVSLGGLGAATEVYPGINYTDYWYSFGLEVKQGSIRIFDVYRGGVATQANYKGRDARLTLLISD